ncbi:hypothetical protein C8F04DRAFT_1250351 [Mycena alexandri]|uniref:Transmembrane protein n=1 Tax=Mycena alexandri TaxID=1745969 RepID=A0AAD6XGG7_9AGAR|nr:hypothetical protein C8F04DRAFT_1250351 [Mycena alexandri]
MLAETGLANAVLEYEAWPNVEPRSTRTRPHVPLLDHAATNPPQASHYVAPRHPPAHLGGFGNDHSFTLMPQNTTANNVDGIQELGNVIRSSSRPLAFAARITRASPPIFGYGSGAVDALAAGWGSTIGPACGAWERAADGGGVGGRCKQHGPSMFYSQRSLLRGVIRSDISSFFLKLPHSSCVKMQLMWKALIVSQELLVECTVIMRVFAMYDRNQWILVCLLAVLAPWPALALWDVIEEGQPQIFSAQGISGCATDLSIACDILVFLLTVRRAYVQRETYPRYAGTLLWRMTNDGAWYFGIIIIANAANLVTFYLGDIFITGFLSWFITNLSITLLARLMLNLHEAAAVGMTGEEPNTIEIETLRFVTVQMTVDVGA